MSLPTDLVPNERAVERREQDGSRSDDRFLGREVTSQFATESVRKDTFKDPWPQKLQNLAKPLAVEGFYYQGADKNVRCFSCGLSLGDWECEDEPWKVHAKHRKDCTFLRSRHGEAIDARDRDTEQKREIKDLKSLLEKSESRQLLQENQLKEKEKEVRELNDYIASLSKENDTLKKEDCQNIQKKNQEIEQLNGYTRSLVEEIENLFKQIQMLKQQKEKEGKEMNDCIASLSKENDTLRKEDCQNIQKKNEEVGQLNSYATNLVKENENLLKEIQRLEQQDNENDAVIKELSHYATCLKEEVEFVRKENRKLAKQVLKLTQRFDLERYFFSRQWREEHSRNAVLNDLHLRAEAEKDKLETEKANVVKILKKQLQVFQAKIDFLYGRIMQLEEQLGRNQDAQEACVGFGSSREDVTEAVQIWERRNPGYKAEDLMEILTERSGEWHEGVVTEENQMETEGAVGGQDEYI